MERRDFLKKIGIGVAVASVVPAAVLAVEDPSPVYNLPSEDEFAEIVKSISAKRPYRGYVVIKARRKGMTQMHADYMGQQILKSVQENNKVFIG
jgi:hypothetical protein